MGEALDSALELGEEVISHKINSIMACLDKLYRKDDILSRFDALESFETYKRASIPGLKINIFYPSVKMSNAMKIGPF